MIDQQITICRHSCLYNLNKLTAENAKMVKKIDTNKNFKALKAQAELNCSQSYFVKRQGIGKKSETKC